MFSTQTADGDSASFVADTVKFVIAFASVISQSTPHIYISALPFAPRDSKVAQMFLPQFPRILSLQTGQATQWPAIQGVFTGHKSAVNSVAFSPDGKRIASGSSDNTIRVWDAETGAVVSGPFEGHSSSINSVAFSPDGKRVASDSDHRTIRMWAADIVSTPSGFHDGSILGDNGWMLNLPSTLLFWVPPWNQKGLLWPTNTTVMGAQPTKLDLSSFVHGTSWTQCRQVE